MKEEQQKKTSTNETILARRKKTAISYYNKYGLWEKREFLQWNCIQWHANASLSKGKFVFIRFVATKFAVFYNTTIVLQIVACFSLGCFKALFDITKFYILANFDKWFAIQRWIDRMFHKWNRKLRLFHHHMVAALIYRMAWLSFRQRRDGR